MSPIQIAKITPELLEIAHLSAEISAGKDLSVLSVKEQTLVEKLVSTGFLTKSEKGFVGHVPLPPSTK